MVTAIVSEFERYMGAPTRTRLSDYFAFHKAAIETQDVDPAYPVLRSILELLRIEPRSDRGIWLSVCHLTFYDIGSALGVWDLTQRGDNIGSVLDATEAKWPIATERRGFRDSRKLRANLWSWLAMFEKFGGPEAYLTADLGDEGREPGEWWRSVVNRIEDVHGNGRWAAFKLAELLQKVNGVPLRPLDMGHSHSSGPRQGLAILYPNPITLTDSNDGATIAALNAISERLVGDLRDTGLSATIENTETTLCDFHALCDGRYYVGHDIDQMQTQLARTPSDLSELAWAARASVLPQAYLGELNGWSGPDTARNKVYRDTGQIVLR